jgi:hypothetical protein
MKLSAGSYWTVLISLERKSRLNESHPFAPFQGQFSHFVSIDIEGDFGPWPSLSSAKDIVWEEIK